LSHTAQVYQTRVKGTGSYLPERLLSNKDLEKFVDTNDAWILERTGIANRAMAAEGEQTSDMALKASQRVLAAAGMQAEELDAIFFATVSPDYLMPNTACILQKKLGAKDVMSFDLSAACSGFLYLFGIAHEFIYSGRYKNILVVGAEKLHPYVNYKDRDTCILFGDGAGAFVIGRAEEGQNSKVYSHHMHADGYISDLLTLPGGGSAMRPTHENLDNGSHFMQMRGREIFKHAVRTMSQCCSEALEANKLVGSDVDWVVPHQANVRIIEAVAKHFGISMEKVVIEIENMGNTSAATVPVAMDKAIRDGRIKRGQNIMLTAFGAGITSGSLLMRY
jgi:3-oxoacyl-[acyl-carrier-protein] synthase III